MYSRFLIGVCSYLLIGYWSHRLSASKSALKAVVVNRLSDGLLLWGVLWVWWHTGSLEYDLVTLSSETSSFLSTAILIGAMGKSAQIGFHVWLADAMEGPTPVSALIHAATLVCAGVYVMVRLSVFYDDVIIVVGALTALMAGIFGYFQSDLKRVIAFSTCSQLGYALIYILFNLIEYTLQVSYGATSFIDFWQSTCSFCFGASGLNPLEFHSLFLAGASGTALKNGNRFFSNANQPGGGPDFFAPQATPAGGNDILPTNAVECFSNLSDAKQRYSIKAKYKDKAVIYMWFNKITGQCYVGRTQMTLRVISQLSCAGAHDSVNKLNRRLENYFRITYLKQTENSMQVCKALLSHGFDSFDLYILEVVSIENINTLPYREDYWVTQVKPSYNKAVILDPFVGANHPRFGKTLSAER